MLPVTWLDEIFLLHPERCMYWEKEQTLIVSDLHLGKTGHFRKEGIAVPQQVYQQDLDRLFDTIRFLKPREVLLTGDLFHSRSNLEWEWFGQKRIEIPSTLFTLVLGNHDKLPVSMAENLGLNVQHFVIKSEILFVHNAEDIQGIEQDFRGTICGHVHPSVKVASGARQYVRLPCFHFAAETCTMPAFSLFTGTHTIKPKKRDRIFALTGTEVMEVRAD